MDLRRISDDFSVSPQIAPEDAAAIRAAGFASIMCNRPDGEDPGQPDVAAIEAAAREAGLEFRAVPIVSGALTQEDVDAFAAALTDMPGPVLAYCRSGTRCATVWSITRIGVQPPDTIVAAAADAGYDVRGIVAQLSGRA